jgi:cytochrome c oxidase subunit 4
VTEQHIAVDDHTHDAGIHDPDDHHNSPDAIKKEVRRYLLVFFALGVLTAITVGVSNLHLPFHQAVIVALIIASIKGSLVAAYFMHLLSEKKVIYGILLLTVIFFAVLLWLPVHDVADKFRY